MQHTRKCGGFKGWTHRDNAAGRTNFGANKAISQSSAQKRSNGRRNFRQIKKMDLWYHLQGISIHPAGKHNVRSRLVDRDGSSAHAGGASSENNDSQGRMLGFLKRIHESTFE